MCATGKIQMHQRSRSRVAVRLVAVLTLALLVGCAGPQPEPLPVRVVQPPAGDLQLAEVLGGVSRYVGAPVRWGGTVVEVQRDSAGNAHVQVVERRLDGDGRPIPGSPSDGRFLILAAPQVQHGLYERGTAVTIAGTVADQQDIRLGDRTITVPRVQVEVFKHWQPIWYGSPYEDPFYDPWYGPWYGPWHGPPWYGPRARFGFGIGHHSGWYRGHGLQPWWW